jgi:hypothetical protein
MRPIQRHPFTSLSFPARPDRSLASLARSGLAGILTRGNISFLPCEDSAFRRRTLRSP